MDILVTFDENYILPFKIMAKSLVMSHPHTDVTFWLIHGGIADERINELKVFCGDIKAEFEAVNIPNHYFEDARVTERYPKSMYYRLLAPAVLPDSLSRILYLDPDILVINHLRDLWHLELSNHLAFAAASHSVLGEISNSFNNLRLDTDHPYFNSGVVLFDLEKARQIIDPDVMIETVNNSQPVNLILPDQDLFNSLYGQYVQEIPDELYNYDTRFYRVYLLNSNQEYNLDWIFANTKILHFCGKKKPWKHSNPGIFNSLYKYFMHQVVNDKANRK